MVRNRKSKGAGEAHRRNRQEESACLKAPPDRAAEELTQQAEQKFQTIFDNTSDGIFLHDLETRKLTMANRSCLQMLGYTENEFLKLHVADLHPRADLPFIEAQIEEFLQGGTPVRHDLRFRRKDGSILFADVNPGLVRLDGRRYVVVVLKDITDRKRMEEQLRRHAEDLETLVEARTSELQESETRYRNLYHTIADGIFVMGADGRIADANDSACRQLGYTREELIGMPVAAISARADFQLAEIFERIRATGSLSYQTAHRRKDGTRIPVELSVTQIEYRGEPAVLGVARDITERQRTKKALQFTQFAIDHTADAAFWMTEDARFCYVNEAACRALGYSRAELLKLAIYDIDPTITPGMWRERWRELQTKKTIIRETVHRAKDGRVFPVEIRANYVRFDGRAFDCAFARDISERKRAQETLQEREYLLSESQRIGQIGSWSADPATGTGMWTQETYRLFGVSPETFVPSAETLLGLLHPDDRDAMLEWIRAALAGEHPEALEVRVPLADGSVRVLSGRGELIYADDHGPVRLVGTVQDVTEHRRAEAALRESEERYRILLEQGFDGIFVHEDFRIVQLNDRLVEITGYPRAELLGTNPLDLFPPESRERIRNYVRSGAAGRYEVDLRRRDGRILEVESFGASCRFQGREARIVGLRDITERRRAQEVQRRLNEQLERQVAERTEDLRHTVDRLRQLTLDLSQAEDRERRRIAAILHEDVQQTLAATRFYVNLLDRKSRSAAELREIVEQAKHLLKEAIEKARNLSHELSPALYQVELMEILRWLARQMKQQHGLTVRVEARGPIASLSEPLKAFLYRVVQELLFNVVKHAGVNEARICVRCRGPCLCLLVTDRGHGFDPRDLEGTTGFGLLSIRERIGLLGGRMRIKSMPGAGSRFLVCVPYETAAPVLEPYPESS